MTAKNIQSTEDRGDAIDVSNIVVQALDCASRFGVDAASAGVGQTQGYELGVRMGELETVEHHNGGNLTVTVYMGNKKGISTTNDFSNAAIADTVRAARTIAKFTADDPCNGLPPTDRLARQIPELELYLPWNIDRDQALEMALVCENSALSSDSRIMNSEGATFGTSISESAFGNSDDFLIHQQTTRHAMSCSVVGKSAAGMQGDYWFDAVRDPALLDSPQSIGLMAAKRTLRRLDARQISTCRVPVLFEAPIASNLLLCLIRAITGPALYRKASFLLDSIGQQIFPPWVRIHEQPHLKRTLGSAVADAEGVATQSRDIVSDGVLQGYVLGSYSARKLGLETTGNAGGVFNLTIDSGKRDFNEMLKLMNRGILVTETMGFGINTVTGDYSQGVRGFWVENGEMQYPVEELTIAGNLRDMFRSIVDVGTDVDLRGNTRTGSILIENMVVAGK